MTESILNQNQWSRWLRVSVLSACLMWGLIGCGDPKPIKVGGEGVDAVAAVTDVLTAWKDGKKTTDLAEQDPKVIVRDEDWEGGAKLKSFEVKRDPKQEGGNWRVETTITLETGSAKPVSYAVVVEPLISVMRMDVIE